MRCWEALRRWWFRVVVGRAVGAGGGWRGRGAVARPPLAYRVELVVYQAEPAGMFHLGDRYSTDLTQVVRWAQDRAWFIAECLRIDAPDAAEHVQRWGRRVVGPRCRFSLRHGQPVSFTVSHEHCVWEMAVRPVPNSLRCVGTSDLQGPR